MKKSPAAIERCKTVSTIQKILGGKWKIEIPPHVEYNLTELGESFIPVYEHIKQWGDEHLSPAMTGGSHESI